MGVDAELIKVLQTAIGPVILISGVGFLLLTMMNRLSRIVDRARELNDDKEGDQAALKRQLDILWSRANTVRLAILLTTTSILSSALLIINLFLAAVVHVDLGWLIMTLFVTSMCFLIGALALFIRDVNRSLEALKIELGR